MTAQATRALEKGISESPVSIAASLESLRESGNLDKIALADMLAEMASLRGSVDRLTANQIAAEKRRESIKFGDVINSKNALLDALGSGRPVTLADYIARADGSAPATRSALAQTLADLAGQDLDQKK